MVFVDGGFYLFCEVLTSILQTPLLERALGLLPYKGVEKYVVDGTPVGLDLLSFLV